MRAHRIAVLVTAEVVAPGEGVEDGALLPGRHTSLHVPATTPRRESGGQGPDKMAGVRLL